MFVTLNLMVTGVKMPGIGGGFLILSVSFVVLEDLVLNSLEREILIRGRGLIFLVQLTKSLGKK